LQRAGRNLVLVGTHPLPPVGNVAAARRDAQLQATARWLARQPEAALLLGDLNATPWSYGMRLLTANSGLRLATTAGRPTWRVGSPFALPIDHALVSGHLRILAREIGPEVGSDHRPQRIDLGWVD
jgi:endonuclease/exonuclease/phosphatase (EEP) superfamily protein YafD